MVKRLKLPDFNLSLKRRVELRDLAGAVRFVVNQQMAGAFSVFRFLRLFRVFVIGGVCLSLQPALAEEKIPPLDEKIIEEGTRVILPADDLLRNIGEAESKSTGENIKPKRLKKAPLVKPLNPLKQALIDYRAQRIEKAIIGFEKAARDQSFIARYLLAHIYRTGKGGEVDHRKAYEYYREITAEFSDEGFSHSRKAPYVAHAYVQLARYMEVGVEELDIKSDPYMARMLFEKAAHFGDIEGQYQLGRFLIESGKMRNVKLGQRWLTRAAMKNNAKAQAYLGALYWQGDLIQRKQSLALAWIEFARRNATGPVKNQVERLYRAVKFDASEEAHDRAEFFIGRLRSKYHVLWREEPAPEKGEDELLDGIILADPPKELDLEQLEAKAPRNQLPDMPIPGPEGALDGHSSPGFGYQMFEYGGSFGR